MKCIFKKKSIFIFFCQMPSEYQGWKHSYDRHICELKPWIQNKIENLMEVRYFLSFNLHMLPGGWGLLLLKTTSPSMLAQFQNAPLSPRNLFTQTYPILSVQVLVIELHFIFMQNGWKRHPFLRFGQIWALFRKTHPFLRILEHSVNIFCPTDPPPQPLRHVIY